MEIGKPAGDLRIVMKGKRNRRAHLIGLP
jgi:hypothetical protein